MIKVYLNSGNLIIFEKGKVTFGKEHLYITYDNITYQKELKNVYKVVEVMEDCNSLQRELYRGYLLKRGVYNIIYLFALPKNNVPPHSKKY